MVLSVCNVMFTMYRVIEWPLNDHYCTPTTSNRRAVLKNDATNSSFRTATAVWGRPMTSPARRLSTTRPWHRRTRRVNMPRCDVVAADYWQLYQFSQAATGRRLYSVLFIEKKICSVEICSVKTRSSMSKSDVQCVLLLIEFNDCINCFFVLFFSWCR